jgi:opacity protein-like surface antigen
MKKFFYIIMFSMITFSLNAEGFYFGAGLNRSESNQHQYSTLTYTEHDDTDIGFKVLVGYDLNSRVGFEAIYNDLGQTSMAVSTPLTSETDVQSFALAAVLKSDPINNFSLFAKIGQNLLHAHDEISDGTGNGVTEMNMYYGAGVSIDTAQDVSWRLEYEEFGKAGGTDSRSDRPDEVDMKNMSISLIKKF